MSAAPAPTPTLLQDMHVHSTFSDGKNTIAENIAEAEELGLGQLTCVDHVRADTDYLPDYVAEIERLRPTTDVELLCGIEAKLLDTRGFLDLPAEIPDGVERIYAADHQVPFADGPHHPRDVKAGIEAGELEASAVIAGIVDSTIGAVKRHDDVVIAHLFSILPKIGLTEDDVADDEISQARRGHRRRWRPDRGLRALELPRGQQPSPRSWSAEWRSCSAPTHTCASKMGRYETSARTLAELGVEPIGAPGA